MFYIACIYFIMQAIFLCDLMMKKLIFLLSLLMPVYAHALIKPTTFTMLCYIASQDDNWTYRDFGFTLTYKDAKGKIQTLKAAASHPKQKNCSTKTISVSGAIPAGPVKVHIDDFTGEAGSTIECTKDIKYRLQPIHVGQVCEFIVKSPKYGSYTSTDECSLIVDCGAHPTSLSSKIPLAAIKK
jgi:hypothetical protein